MAACGAPAGDVDAAAGAAATSSSEPRYGGNLILGTGAEPVTFSMPFMQEVSSWIVATLIFDGLMETTETLDLEPRIAIAPPEISPDGTVWTYRLRNDVRFHDGVALTAHDVAFTYRLFLHPDYKGPWGSQLASLASIDALDDHTVRFTFSTPDARFASYSRFAILPRHLLEHVPVAELADYRAFNVEHPVGAGPFKFVSWTRGENLVLEASDDYYRGRPYLDRVTFRFIPNASARVLALEAGDIDLTAVPAADAAAVRAMPHVVLEEVATLGYSYIGWNLRRPLFADRRVRQALTHAIDRQELVDTFLDGHGEVAHSPASPPIAWNFTDDVPKFSFDPDRAKALLGDAGWQLGPDGFLSKDGARFEFELLIGSADSADVAAVVQQALRAIGIDVRVTRLEWSAFLQRVRAPSFAFDAVLMGMVNQEDADPSLQWHSRAIAQGSNDIGFSDARVDELIDRSTRVIDRDARAAILGDVWRLIAEEQPVTFLFYPRPLVAVRTDVRDLVQHPQRQTYRLERVWLDR